MGAANHSLVAVSPFAVPMPPYPFGFGGFYTVPFLLDFAALKVSQAWTINCANADILYLTTIPIGAQIHGVLMDVETACTNAGTVTVSVGDYSDLTGTAINAAGYMAATTIKTAGYTGTILTDVYAAATKVYNHAEYLALTFGGNETDVRFGRIWLAVKISFITFPNLTVVAPALWH